MNLWMANRRVQLIFWPEHWFRLYPRYYKWPDPLGATLNYSLSFGFLEIRVWHIKEMSNYLWNKLRRGNETSAPDK